MIYHLQGSRFDLKRMVCPYRDYMGMSQSEVIFFSCLRYFIYKKGHLILRHTQIHTKTIQDHFPF